MRKRRETSASGGEHHQAATGTPITPASGSATQSDAAGSGQQHDANGSGQAPASRFLAPDLDEFWGHQVAEKAKPKVLGYFALATLIVAVFSFLYGKELIDSSVKSEIKSVIDSKSSEVDKQIDELMKPQLARIDALKKQADDLAGEIEQLKKNTETRVSEFSTLIIGSEQQIRQFTAHQTEIRGRPPIVDLSSTIGEIIDSGDSSSGEGVAPIYAIQSMLAKIGQPTRLSYAGVFYSAGGTNFGVAPESMFTVLKNLGAYTAADWPREFKTKPANISPVVTITAFYSRNVFTKDDVIEELRRGKVLVAIFDVDPVFQGYTAGVFKVPGQSQKANHAIAVVGYDDDTSSFKVANSWGSHWGEAGFARIDRDAFVSRTLQIFVIDDLQIAAH